MSGGTEERTQILPSVQPEDTGYVQPRYDIAGNIPSHFDIGAGGYGGNIGDLIGGMRGVAYYPDVIGAGQSTNFITRGLPFQPLGIRYFHKTGLVCDNGSDMWAYFDGVPKGNSLGKTITSKLAGLGLPSLRGLAPGILEDAQAALNPMPMAQAIMGGAYPKCVQTTLPVGDTQGKTRDDFNGDEWIQGDIQYTGGQPHQSKWVQAKDKKGNPIYLSKAEWDKTPKIFNRNGTPAKKQKDGFEDLNKGHKISMLLAVVFLCGAVIVRYL
jgi:hypothetical protein